MDYDKTIISAVYDQARGLAPGLLQRWLDMVAGDASPARGSLIIDVGCGTDRFSEPLAERFSARASPTAPTGQRRTDVHVYVVCQRRHSPFRHVL